MGKAFLYNHNLITSLTKFCVNTFLGVKSIMSQSPQIQTGLNSFLEKIPILGLIPFAKMAQSAFALSNFAIALNALTAAPVAVAIFGETKNVYSESSQLVNPFPTPANSKV